MICLKLATRTGSFQVEVDATPADCGVANINYERKPLAVPGTRNTGTNYADSRYQLPQIDSQNAVETFEIAIRAAIAVGAAAFSLQEFRHCSGVDVDPIHALRDVFEDWTSYLDHLGKKGFFD